MPQQTRSRSEEIYRRSCEVIPGGVNSPVRAFRSLGMCPLIVKQGIKDIIVDEDGREYIDYCGSWGAAILGHAPSRITRAAAAQMRLGSSFGIATLIEEQLASKIIRHVPSIEKIRFVSSGTEAGMSVIRLARGFTGRSKIVKFSGCYHGHSDSLLMQAGSGVLDLNAQATSKGVLEGAIRDTISLPFNDALRVRELFASALRNEIAAVILEPIPGNMGVVLPEPHFLQALREETAKAGALLIFDEVITGFRVALQGAQGLYGIRPDLSCFGKVIGGGFPAAAFGGRAEIMDCLSPLGQVYQAGTLSGNPVAMRAGFETLTIIEQPLFYEHLQQKTNLLTDPIRAALLKTGKAACLQQAGSMFTLFFGPRQVLCKEDLAKVDAQRFAHFFRYLFERGVYIPPLQQEAWFVSSAHSKQHLEKTAELIVRYIEQDLGS